MSSYTTLLDSTRDDPLAGTLAQLRRDHSEQQRLIVGDGSSPLTGDLLVAAVTAYERRGARIRELEGRAEVVGRRLQAAPSQVGVEVTIFLT